jgi:formamidopyrimidine-DNA glycosylase
MGKVYVTDALERIPTYAELGPEATDSELTLDAFAARLRGQRGEIKSVLTRQSFVAGIGNAYADEICWRAEIYPFRRRSALSEDEIARLYRAMRDVLAEATATIRQRTGNQTDVEIRDFLSVHGRAGETCPRCGSKISEVKRERRATHFCRTCQPGLMLNRFRAR